jgi:GNAT superfamily N-acetyltransferase
MEIKSLHSAVRLRGVVPEKDFPAVVTLINSFERIPTTLAQVEKSHAFMPEGRICRRTAAVDARDAMIGYCVAAHETWFSEGEYYVWAVVDPQQRSQHIGTCLIEDALVFLKEQGAQSLRSEVRDDDELGLRFAEKYGFSIRRHMYESTLDLTAFDETPYAGLVPALEAEGYRFFSLADVGDTTEARRNLHQVNYQVVLDIPGFSGDWMTFDQFDAMICGSDWYRADGQFAVMYGDRWVGLAAVQLLPEMKTAYNLITGVIREHRGHKIAQALKYITVRYARQHGAEIMHTDNDSLNAPMLAVNQKFGYQPDPGKYFLERKRVG